MLSRPDAKRVEAAMTTRDVPISDEALRAHFDRVMARRKARVSFDRFEQASIENDGVRLHLDVIAAAEGRPSIVFIPGTSVYGLTFGNFLAAVADRGVNVVSVDPRGHGRSGGPRGSYTVPELVSDARAAIRYAKARFKGQIFVCGSSQGGVAAFYTAATDAELAGAICHNAADLADPGNFELTDRPKLARALRPLTLGLAALAPELPINTARYYALLSRGDSLIKQRLAEDPLSLKVIRLKALASLATAKLERPVEAIRTPILLLHGGEDRIFPRAFIERLYARLTCPKTLKIYDGLGHFLVTEEVDAILPDILAFIEERRMAS
jgi:alpha-beta hydrolase superfamily lysophospholipase